MNHSILPTQGLRTTHTPAICDSGCQTPETRANAGFARSTAPNEGKTGSDENLLPSLASATNKPADAVFNRLEAKYAGQSKR